MFDNMASKPLLLLDVDGFINDIKAVMVLRMLSSDKADRAAQLGIQLLKSHEHHLAVPFYMPELMSNLTSRSETWWCTTWRERANDEVAAHLAVGPFPVPDPHGHAVGLEWKLDHARPLVANATAEGRSVV